MEWNVLNITIQYKYDIVQWVNLVYANCNGNSNWLKNNCLTNQLANYLTNCIIVQIDN